MTDRPDGDPYPSVAARPDFPAIETAILDRWAREAEDAIIEVLARVRDAERAEAIALLAELREP